MSSKMKAYVALIIAAGASFFVYMSSLSQSIDIYGVTLFLVLSFIAESIVVLTPGGRALSIGFAVGLAAIIVFGVPEAIWIASIGVMLRMVKNDGRYVHILNYPVYKTLFNGANITLSLGFAGLCYIYFGGIPGRLDLNSTTFAIIACIIVCILVNAIIMSVLMVFITGNSFFDNFFKDILWVVKDYFSVAPFGILMAAAYINYGVLGVMIFFGPLLFARYSFKLYVDMKKICLDTVKSLSQAVEAKDPYTNGHSRRVVDYACGLAERMHLSQKRTENLRIAAILHDIGKIGVDESILNKPGRLTEEEFGKIKQHPEIGVKIIKDIDFLKDASDIILSHHERYDGKGYPGGKVYEKISVESQILSIADVFDALTSERPYRNAMSVDEAVRIIIAGKGTQFDSDLVDAFIEMLIAGGEMKRVAN